jgi:signal transduction histidine kinase
MTATSLNRWLLVMGAFATFVGVPLALLAAHLLGMAAFPSDFIAAEIFTVTGAIAVWQQPNHLAAHRLLLAGVIYLTANTLERALSLVAVAYGAVTWFWVGNAVDQSLQIATMAAWVGLCAVFPDGRYQRRYERWIVWAVWVLVATVPMLLLVTQPRLYVNAYVIWAGSNAASPSPLFVPSLALLGGPAQALWVAAAFLPALVGAGLLVLRYRRFAHEQRLQILWPVLAALALGLALVSAILSAYGLVSAEAPVVLFHVTILLLPITLAIGLLRHRLFDVEVVLGKSLVYGMLWLAISLGSIALTAVLGVAVGRLLPISLAILLTIIATMVFQPARRRLERAADRLVFGERLSGPELLARFGATLESAFDLNELAPRVTSTVCETLSCTWVRLSLHQDGGAELLVESFSSAETKPSASSEPGLAVPLTHGGEQLGAIACGPKLAGSFDSSDEQLLATIARQTALAIRNIWMAAELARRLEEIQQQASELAASRARLVQAADQERRRIERNLHDGAQQELVALLAKIRLARNQLARQAPEVERTLEELQADARQALDDLRELARGIHPPVLSDRGLLEAIEGRIARLPLDVSFEAAGVRRGTRYRSEIEGAAYFFVCEGLANVLKHAGANHATVRLASVAGALHIDVSDDGTGFDTRTAAHSGLRGLQDRIEALGGSVQVVSSAAQGTTLRAAIPLQEARDG